MSVVLAKILGLYFLSVGLAFIINPDRLRQLYPQIKRDENFLLLGGMLALLIGAFVVALHNIWSLDWPLIITVLGWWSLLKGFGLLVYPDFIKYFSFLENRSNLFYRLISLVYLCIGLFLVCMGWK